MGQWPISCGMSETKMRHKGLKEKPVGIKQDLHAVTAFVFLISLFVKISENYLKGNFQYAYIICMLVYKRLVSSL